jgi:hypothetical protein
MRTPNSRFDILVLVVASCVAMSATSFAEEKAKEFPKGAAKAVKAVQEALPKAEIDAVEQPKGFGSDPKGEAPLFWTIRLHVKDDKQELSVTPEGLIIRFPTTVNLKDLPEKIKDGLAKRPPVESVVKIEKQETRASIRYAALEKPEISYHLLVVAKDDKKVSIRAAADGTILQQTPVKDAKEPEKEEAKPKDEAKPANPVEKKKPTIPEAAAKAVKAVQDLLPDAEITGVENVGYQDGTGPLEILNYEVEYTLKGVEHELNVTPEGVIIHVALPVEVKELPKKVADAVAKEIPDGKVQKATKEETRAGLKFVALEKPKVLYVVTLEGTGKKSTLKFLPDGSEVKDVNPFAKKDEEKPKEK